jgi:hypothetical protein
MMTAALNSSPRVPADEHARLDLLEALKAGIGRQRAFDSTPPPTIGTSMLGPVVGCGRISSSFGFLSRPSATCSARRCGWRDHHATFVFQAITATSAL